jgi:hypothetical protein
MVAWGARDMATRTNGWDIYARPFSSAGVGGATVRVNSFFMAINMRRASARLERGLFDRLDEPGPGRFARGRVMGNSFMRTARWWAPEFRVNTTTIGSQMQPAVASDGASQFLVVWTGFTFSAASFDLFAQRYANVNGGVAADERAVCLGAVCVEQRRLSAAVAGSWSALVAGNFRFQLRSYVDGAASPMALDDEQCLDDDGGEWFDGRQHPFVPGGLRDDGRAPLPIVRRPAARPGAD